MFDRIFQDIFPATVFPAVTVVLLAVFFIYYIKILRPARGTTEWITMKVAESKCRLTLPGQRYPVTKTDIFPLCLITAAFMILAVISINTAPSVYLPRSAVRTNPPLGEIIMYALDQSSLQIASSPQLTGAVIGAAIPAVTYIFVKNMFGKTSVAVCAALLIGFDTMRLSLSRSGSIDIPGMLFTLLAYYFMYRLITTPHGTKVGNSLLPMAMSGLFFGLSVAVKWTGLFAGLGLAAIFIIRLLQLGLYAVADGKSDTSGAVRYRTYFIQSILFGLLFFMIIPAVIYYLSYIPAAAATGMTFSSGMLWSKEYIDLILRDITAMSQYHTARLTGDLAGGPQWGQLLYIIYPVINTFNIRSGYTEPSIPGTAGNPALFWGGVAAVAAVTVYLFTKRDGKALFIIIGYLSCILSWLLLGREHFAYCYFPCIIFLVLATAHIFNTVLTRAKKGCMAAICGFTALTGIVFAVFYPLIIGANLPNWYHNVFTDRRF